MDKIKYIDIHALLHGDFLREFSPFERFKLLPLHHNTIELLKYRGATSYVHKIGGIPYQRYLFYMQNPIDDGIVLRICYN